MDLRSFLKENNGFPENRKVQVSPCFTENGVEIPWEIRAVSEGEFRRAAEGKKDPWAALCLLSMVFPDLKDRELWESYGVDSGEQVLKEMLYPGEYLRLLEAVKEINGFQRRKKEWKEQAKN